MNGRQLDRYERKRNVQAQRVAAAHIERRVEGHVANVLCREANAAGPQIAQHEDAECIGELFAALWLGADDGIAERYGRAGRDDAPANDRLLRAGGCSQQRSRRRYSYSRAKRIP